MGVNRKLFPFKTSLQWPFEEVQGLIFRFKFGNRRRSLVYTFKCEFVGSSNSVECKSVCDPPERGGGSRAARMQLLTGSTCDPSPLSGITVLMSGINVSGRFN